MSKFPTLVLIGALLVIAVDIRAASDSPSDNIDKLIEAKLKENELSPNEEIAEGVFLRRVYLDIVGRVPTIEEAEAFHSESYENKRERLIEKLLSSEGYVSDSYHLWADILRINGEPGGTVSSAYELWVKDALRKNMPYDEFVHSLITAEGKFWENGAVGYYFRDRGMPLDNMSNTVRVFLGTRLECAQCHDHPFDKWTQMDYFKMASFSYGMNTRAYDSMNRNFANREIKRGGAEAYREKAIELTGSRKFPVFARESQLEKYLETVPENPERTKVGSKEDRKKERKRNMKKARQSDRLQVGVAYHARFDMTKEEFADVVKQCLTAAEEVSGRRSTMREVLSELYDPLQYTAVTSGEKNAELPHDYAYDDAKPHDKIMPATMFGYDVEVADGEKRIEAYGRWMTSPENPTFTRVIANRLWKEVFGHGVFEPVDELTDHTVITNPELLSYLEELMVELDYDMRAFQSILYNTKAYQRGAYAGEVELGAPYYFPGPKLRRMSAEQIWDSLVALALPEADRYQPNLEKKLTAIQRIEKIYQSLEERPFDEFMKMVREVEPIVASLDADAEAYREAAAEARLSGDATGIRKIRAEYQAKKKQMTREIGRIAYSNLQEEIDGGELLLAMGFLDAGGELTSEMEAEEEGSDVRYITTSLPKAPEARRGKAHEKEARKRMVENGKLDRSDIEGMREDIKSYQKMVAGMARASELPSPAKRGHFLRDFGQSDREVIENAAEGASVPQALNLLNGPIVDSLTNRFSTFGRRIHAAGDVDEKAHMIFQAMLTRKPTDEELNLVRAEVEANGEEAYEGIVWALLNTQQFLFVE
ncbi:DUF1549 and DUF1553 domain-containing protein [Verrucomicrobiales bacterium]|jgi:hypothetical protein|nr:DUF1549 and DUF1553 domain-containing protein [Verrucomicrobiales bacterium]